MKPYLYKGITHFMQGIKALFIGAYQDNRHNIILLHFFCTFIGIVIPLDIKKAHVHVQVTSVIETRQAYGDPAFSTPSLNSIRFEDHVEDELEVSRVKRVLLWPNNAHKSSTSNQQAVKQRFSSSFEEGVADNLAVGFPNF